MVTLGACADTIFTTYRSDYATLVPQPAARAPLGSAVIEFDFENLDRTSIVSAVKRGAPPTREMYPSVWQHPYSWQGGINTAIVIAIGNVVASSFDLRAVQFRGLAQWDVDRAAVAGRWAAEPDRPPEYVIRFAFETVDVTRFGYVQGGWRADAISEEIEVALRMEIQEPTGSRRSFRADDLRWQQTGRQQSARSTILLTESLMRQILDAMQLRLDAELRRTPD